MARLEKVMAQRKEIKKLLRGQPIGNVLRFRYQRLRGVLE
jgi:hypothetical protein